MVENKDVSKLVLGGAALTFSLATLFVLRGNTKKQAD